MTQETQQCQNCKNQFTIEPEDFAFYEKIKVPPPTWCPECRLIRRLAWRNERTFYKRHCDKCGKSMISVFSPESGLTVYCSSCWWSDDWDAMDYGVDFDPKKPFFKQLRDLLQRVPMMNLFGLGDTIINSDYTNMVSHLKNCYMVTYSDVGENLTYGSFVNNSKDSVDNLMANKMQLCYEDVNSSRCYKTFFSIDCSGCNEVYFSKNCWECNNCFGCVNLRKKQYYFFNQPLSQEEYKRRIQAHDLGSSYNLQKIRDKARKFWVEFPSKYMHERHNSGASGDYIYHSKNVYNSFIVDGAEDSRFCAFVDSVTGKLTDAYDFTNYGVASSLLYESLQVGDQASRVLFSWWNVTHVYDIEYSFFQIGCSNNFGSVGLKKKQYCILNKQYTKESFDELRTKIIQQMNDLPYIDKKGSVYKYGEFFPPALSPFSYNETSAQEYFPLTKEEALSQGYSWRDPEPRNYPITIKTEDIPDNIKDVNDSILNEVIECFHKGQCNEQCTEAFRIIPQELQFYRKMNLPLPRLCPNCRHYQRLKQRNPLKLWKRQCQCAGEKSQNNLYQNTTSHTHGTSSCPNTFETSYSPDRPEIVYCEQCYLKEVV